MSCRPGTCILNTGNLPPIQLEAGDVIVFPRGDQHTMASEPGLKPVPTRDIYQKVSSEKIAVVKHGGGGDPASFICGFLHSDQRFGPLLESLPALLWIRSRNGVLAVESFGETGRHVHTVAQYEEAGLWQATLRYFISETTAAGPGNRAVLARLSELLFMQVMRWQLAAIVEGRRGWLAGLSDPQIGRALTLMHSEPQKAWTVEDLAGEVGDVARGLCRPFRRPGGRAADAISRRLAHASGAASVARFRARHRRSGRPRRLRIRSRLQPRVPARGRHPAGSLAARGARAGRAARAVDVAVRSTPPLRPSSASARRAPAPA